DASQRQSAHHAPDPRPNAQDRAGEALRRPHGQGPRRLRGASVGLPQRQVGLCFPSYKRIAAAAHCVPSTVGEAISALEAAGLLEWVNRIKRVREWMPGLPGVGVTRVRVVRTSNAYSFRDPKPAPASKTDLPLATSNQGFIPLFASDAAVPKRLGEGLAGAL